LEHEVNCALTPYNWTGPNSKATLTPLPNQSEIL